MPIQVNTPSDAVVKLIARNGLNIDTDGSAILTHVGFRSETHVQIACTDTTERKDGVLQATGEELVTPRVQVRVRHNDYPTTYRLIKGIAKALSGLSQQSLFVLDYPDEALLFASCYIYSGPMYMGRDSKPGELENFSLNCEVTIIPFNSGE